MQVRKSAQYNVSAVLKGSVFMVTSPLRRSLDKSEDDSKTEANTILNRDMNSVTASTMDTAYSTSSDDEDSGNGDKGEPEEGGDVLVVHPAAGLIGDFLIGQVKSNGNMTAANKSTLHMLVFTRQVIMAMPKDKLQVSSPSVILIIEGQKCHINH